MMKGIDTNWMSSWQILVDSIIIIITILYFLYFTYSHQISNLQSHSGTARSLHVLGLARCWRPRQVQTRSPWAMACCWRIGIAMFLWPVLFRSALSYHRSIHISRAAVPEPKRNIY